MKFKQFFSSLLLLFFTSVTGIYAGLADSYGFSAVGIARAGAFAADVNGWPSAFYNIGGLTVHPIFQGKQSLKKSKTLDQQDPTGSGLPNEIREQNYPVGEIGIAYIYQITQGKINLNTASAGQRQDLSREGSSKKAQENLNEAVENVANAQDGLNYGMIQLGMSVDLRPIVATPYDVPLKLGLVLTVRDNGALASFNDIDPSAYNFLRYGKEAETINVITGIGFQLWKDRLSVGVGGNLGINGQATFNVTNFGFKVGDDPQLPGHEFKTDVRPSFSAVVGLVYIQPISNSHEVRFGGSYRQETKVSLDSISGNAHIEPLNVDFPVEFALLDFYVPSTYTLGLSYGSDFSGHTFILSYDQEFQQWSTTPLSSSKEKYFKNEGINVSVDFQDILISKVSLEYHPDFMPVELRGGYAYRPAFTPDQKGLTNFLDNSRHIMGFGFSVLFDSNLVLKNSSKLNIGVQYQKSSLRNSVKSGLDDGATLNNLDYTYSSDVLVFGADFVLTF